MIHFYFHPTPNPAKIALFLEESGLAPAAAVAEAIATGIETGAFEVIRGGETRAQMIALNREDPAAVDERFLGLKPALEEAVKDHAAL